MVNDWGDKQEVMRRCVCFTFDNFDTNINQGVPVQTKNRGSEKIIKYLQFPKAKAPYSNGLLIFSGQLLIKRKSTFASIFKEEGAKLPPVLSTPRS